MKEFKEYLAEVKSVDSKLEKWWRGITTKELTEKIKSYSDEELTALVKVEASGGQQKNQVELAERELLRRKRKREDGSEYKDLKNPKGWG